MKTYATLEAISEAVTNFRGTRQLIKESEQDFASHLNDVAYCCGNVHDELREDETISGCY